jgi:hypothetical protein
MAERGGQDFLSRLADRGEEAISRLADAPGGGRLADVIRTTRDRVDDLQKKMRGIDALEKRVAELEKRVNELQGKRTPAAKPPAPRKRPAAKPKPAGSSSSTPRSRGSSSGGSTAK